MLPRLLRMVPGQSILGRHMPVSPSGEIFRRGKLAEAFKQLEAGCGRVREREHGACLPGQRFPRQTIPTLIAARLTAAVGIWCRMWTLGGVSAGSGPEGAHIGRINV